MDLPSFKVDFTLKREQCYRLFPSGLISLQDFVTVHKGTFTSDSRDAAGCNDLFGLPWSEFITDNSPFFIHDKLHLRVFAVMNQQP
jgi:hypothetical protein